MALELVIQDNYGWVLVAAVANILLMQYMGVTVGRARRTYKVPYPTMYANEKENEQGKAFNCVQRAHQNSLEFLPGVLTALLLGGLQYPIVAATLGGSYFLARIQYFRGYSLGVPSKRFSAGGALIFPTYFGLIFCTIALILHIFFPHLL